VVEESAAGTFFESCLAIVIRRKDVTAIYKKFELFKGEILFLNRMLSTIFCRTKRMKKNKKFENYGRVIEVKDTIVYAEGLFNVKAGDSVLFNQTGVRGLVLNLEKDRVGIVTFDPEFNIKPGAFVTSTGTFSVTADINLLGAITDSLGNVVVSSNIQNNIEDIEIKNKEINIERKAPGVITRKSVHEPMLTGYTVVDSLFPIGRGQRELIIGDRQVGKTTLAIDTIINQRGYNNISDTKSKLFCVYVAVGQKKSSVLQIRELLHKENALSYSIIVAATAADQAAAQYMAPYTGTAISEFFRDQGLHALIVYDDLSKHAAAYRQLSLLLRRPPGREAFPGDIFYAHSRLLERSCKLNDNYGGGSLTALPIIETQAGDLSAYIPTNVISITDGQIFLQKELFFKGQRPAVDVGNSVSRVGSKAQPYALKIATGSLRFELAQYRELAIFSQFDNALDPVTKATLRRGSILTEVLKQAPNTPLPLHKMVLLLQSANSGLLASTISEKISSGFNKYVKIFEKKLFEYVETENILAIFGPLFTYLDLMDKNDFSEENHPFNYFLDLFIKELENSSFKS